MRTTFTNEANFTSLHFIIPKMKTFISVSEAERWIFRKKYQLKNIILISSAER